MAEKTTTLRTLIPPLRRDAKLAPVADALENAQVQLDSITKRISTAETTVAAVVSSVDHIEEVVVVGVDDVTLVGDPTITKKSDGTLTISVQYVPPYIGLPDARYIGEFAGVTPVYEGPTGVVEPYADQTYMGTPTADPPANLGTVSITRRFTAGETFYLHALSWMRTGWRKSYEPHTTAPSMRWMAITVTGDDLTGYPTDGNVTSLAATVLSSRVDQAGKQWAKIRATYGIVPGLETYRAYAYFGADPPEDIEDWGRALGESTGTRIDFEVEVPEAGGTYQIAVTASARGVTVPLTATTPVTEVVLDPWGAAPQVTFFFVQVVNVERNGVPVVELAFNFTKPSSTNWAGVRFQIREGTSGGGYAVGSEWKDYGEIVTTAVSRFWGVATSAAQYYHFRAFSVSPAGKSNEDTPPSDFVTIGAGAGINLAAAKDLSYTSDFAISGGQLTIQGVNFGLAYGYDSQIFTLSGGAFTVDELGADKIVTGTLGVGVVYAGAVYASQFEGGTATLTESLVLDFTVGDVTLDQDGIDCYRGSFSGYVAAADGFRIEGVTFASLYSAGNVLVSAARVTCSNTFTHSGSTVSLTSAANWRTALGLGSAATAASTDFAAASHTHTPWHIDTTGWNSGLGGNLLADVLDWLDGRIAALEP